MSADRDFEVVVVGGGHNGLTAAAELARQGARVCVLERRSDLGGMAATVEAVPGLEVDLAAEDIGLYRSDLIDQLELPKHGLSWVDAPAFSSSLTAQGSATPELPVTLWCDVRRAADELERWSKHDARGLPGFLRTVEQIGGELEGLLRRPPTVEDLGRMLSSPELVRMMTAPAAEVVSEWFEIEAARVLLSSLGVFGVACGPRAQGTGALLLAQLAGTTALGLRPVRWVQGGSGRLSDALAASATARGAVIRREVEVTRIHTERTAGQARRAVAVELAGGETVSGGVILSSLDLRRTLVDLVGEDQLELRVVRRVRSGKYRGAVSRLVLELDGEIGRDIDPPPGFSSAAGLEAMSGRMIMAPSVDAIEQAADACKYGELSPRPVLDVKVPDLGRGGDAASVLTINAQYAPFGLRSGDWNDQREAWTAAILETLEAAWPALGGRVERHRLWSPADWCCEVGATEGSATQGEMNLGQMFVFRPLPGAGGCGTSIDHLLLCGAGAHPGGGVTGLPGAQAASRALDLLGTKQ